MASEGHEDDAVTVSVPPEVDDWLDEQADRHGESQAAFCRRVLRAAHAVSDADAGAAVADRDDLDSLRGQLDAQREEFIDHVEDVRERVIQVKRELDSRAPADHDHEGYADAATVESIATDVEALERDLSGVAAELETVSEGSDIDLEPVEAAIEAIGAELETISERSTILASAVLDLRDTRAELLEGSRRRAAVERLQRDANRRGIASAQCEACGSSVDLSLLTEPTCPHCETAVTDVERRTSILGSHTLVTGDPRALPGDVETDGPDRATLEAAATDGDPDA